MDYELQRALQTFVEALTKLVKTAQAKLEEK